MTLKLNGSSSGSVSIDAPADTTNGVDVALTLPVDDGDSGQYLQTNGSGALSFATVSAGITEYDVWRVTTDVSNPGDITANWERNDSAWFEKIGTGMTESSGIFTFPSTGKWDIRFQVVWLGVAEHDYTYGRFYHTANNGTDWNVCGNTMGSIFNSGGSQYMADRCNAMVDITDVSNQKLKFYGGGSNSPTLKGGTDYDNTFATFMRIGDT